MNANLAIAATHTPSHRSHHRNRRVVGATAALALAIAGIGGIAAASPAEAAPYCGIVWGSLQKTAGPMSSAQIQGVRSGRHACFDRLVIDLSGRTAPGYRVAYVDKVTEDGSGRTVALRGAARLQITALAPAYTSAGNATYAPANRSKLVDVSGYSTFRQVAWAGSFEGQSTIGLGVRARLPFRTFVLSDAATGTQRLVIDVAHRW